MSYYKLKWVADCSVTVLECERDKHGDWRVVSSQDIIDGNVVFTACQGRLPAKDVITMMRSLAPTTLGRVVKKALIDAGLFNEKEMKRVNCILTDTTGFNEATITLIDCDTKKPLWDVYVKRQVEVGVVNPRWKKLTERDREYIREYNDGLTMIPECGSNEELFSWLLEYEGICGYDQWILETVSRLFGAPHYRKS